MVQKRRSACGYRLSNLLSVTSIICFIHMFPLGRNAAHRESSSTTNPVNPHSSELLGQIALGPFPPGNSLPSILEQLFQESVGLSTWYPVLQTAGPSWSTLALVRRGWLFSGVLFHILGQTEASSGGYADQIGESSDLQFPGTGVGPLTGIDRRSDASIGSGLGQCPRVEPR